MIHLRIYSLHPDKIDRLRAWFAEAERRADEVRDDAEHKAVMADVIAKFEEPQRLLDIRA
jgi:hypothetical protein